ncbi:hypothetical protein F5J12DRAFT_889595 [Pisolithus orientalis]|uniref:uncharacterized protein n=1 Tax=Pisolithus orientalis TaxID=936130 RepID=UPI002223F123|nr:uncharacterized protein F5J12DRAFT_889595 [Pisolithus orientalis]KAI6025700.1 hypothetical protein F5J12DRAFT_889595 [Pisolithus orientalis]
MPWPKESLEAIYEWVEDWDQTWAGIYSWWKYIDENKISIPKVCDANLHDMTKESAIWQNEVILEAIAIADLWWPEGQHRFIIDDLVEDYQEQVEERAWLEAKRFANALSMHTWGQAARGGGQDCKSCMIDRGGSGSTSKGKGKQKATSKEDKLANDIDDDEGDGKGEGKEPSPSPHDSSPSPCLFFCGATPMPGPLFKPSPPPVNKPHLTPPINKPQVKFEPFSATATSLLNEPGDIESPAQGDTPAVAETLEVIDPLLEARAEDEEFELEQFHQLLEMLARWVTLQIEAAQARWEELHRLKDKLQDL